MHTALRRERTRASSYCINLISVRAARVRVELTPFYPCIRYASHRHRHRQRQRQRQRPLRLHLKHSLANKSSTPTSFEAAPLLPSNTLLAAITNARVQRLAVSARGLVGACCRESRILAIERRGIALSLSIALFTPSCPPPWPGSWHHAKTKHNLWQNECGKEEEARK